MFVEKLTEYDINQFRFATPIRADGKIVPVRVYCDDRFYDDPRGNSPYILFLKDFNCRISHCRDEYVKTELNRLYIKFMRKTFGEEYENALSNHILNTCKEGTEVDI